MVLHHGHEHSHQSDSRRRMATSFGPAFALGTLLNVGLVVTQVVYGINAHSIALVADAGHNLGDALSLLLAWGAYVIARWQPTERYTYGFRSASILAALVNVALLFLATGAIVWESVHRFADPPPVAAPTVMAVAAMAIVVNLLSAWLISGGEHDLNIRSAFVHLIADAAVSLAVVIAGGAILLTGWYWVDPVASLIISAVIVWGAWGLLREAVNLSLQSVPADIEPGDVRGYLEALPSVSSIHDLHIWAMSTTEIALTCHFVMPYGAGGDEFIDHVCEELHRRFGIEHSTIQIETNHRTCRLAPADVV
jgi:cobalt-zinc-cadmium efflux system protein